MLYFFRKIEINDEATNEANEMIVSTYDLMQKKRLEEHYKRHFIGGITAIPLMEISACKMDENRMILVECAKTS